MYFGSMNVDLSNLKRAAVGGPFWCATLVLFVGILSCASDDQHDGDVYVASFATEPPTMVLATYGAEGWTVRNGHERITLTRTTKGDYRVPVFNGSWSGSWVGRVWEGVWTDSLRPNNYQVSVRLEPLADTSPVSGVRDTTYWETSEGLLVLERCQDSAWATISTPTGDYRHLAGKTVVNQLVLNTFDGSHLFRFDATLRNDSLVDGRFLSGTHYHTPFEGVKRTTQSHTWTSGRQNVVVDELLFFGTNPSGQAEVWNKDRLRRAEKKGLVVDIMGTWCPNCMDEARLMVSLAKSFPDVQFLTLGYERTADSTALSRLVQFKQEMGMDWPVLLGGRASKTAAALSIPALDSIHSFPTTVFWPLEGEPVVHKGFNGPATGEGYTLETAFFRSQLERLSGRSENH
jgi:thiol-disulfide isomerase/thioredoxin